MKADVKVASLVTLVEGFVVTAEKVVVSWDILEDEDGVGALVASDVSGVEGVCSVCNEDETVGVADVVGDLAEVVTVVVVVSMVSLVDVENVGPEVVVRLSDV